MASEGSFSAVTRVSTRASSLSILYMSLALSSIAWYLVGDSVFSPICFCRFACGSSVTFDEEVFKEVGKSSPCLAYAWQI